MNDSSSTHENKKNEAYNLEINLNIESASLEVFIVNLSIKNNEKENFQLDPVIKGPRVSNNFFKIQKSGKSLDYQGVMKKRIKPEQSQFIYIKPDETYNTRFEINKNDYGFSKKGTYKIKLNVPNHFSKHNMTLSSEWIEFKVD